MDTLTATAIFGQDIRKSRFLACCGPVGTEQAAKAFIAQHADLEASHNCWAWRIGQTYRFSDDGEPSGTAGKPILQALDGQALDNVAVLVKRWFGGVLLGSGGLMRAYGGTAAACLRMAEKVALVESVDATIVCDFSALALIRVRLAGQDVRVTKETFTGTGAQLNVTLPNASLDAVTKIVMDCSRGRAIVSADDR